MVNINVYSLYLLQEQCKQKNGIGKMHCNESEARDGRLNCAMPMPGSFFHPR